MKNNEFEKLTEEELIDFWNSYYLEKQANEKTIILPKNENDLNKIVFDIEQAIIEKRLSEAYNLTKYLLNNISEVMLNTKETMKVVINDGYGGFSLSREAMDMLGELKQKKASEINIYSRDFLRHDEDLVRVVETLGDKSSAVCAELKIIEIPKGINYTISDYDGWETVVY